MRISNLEIRNFKAVRNLSLTDLSDVILVAGPNGCGKSCIFDAIRLLKSLYGGYRQQNEWQNFFSEFQLNLNNTDELRRLFTNTAHPIAIAAEFEITASEQDYIRANARTMMYQHLWRSHVGGRSPIYLDIRGAPAGLHDAINQISATADTASADITRMLDQNSYRAQLTLDTGLRFEILPNPVLQLAFGIYDPKNIGVIDFHSPNRNYQRERIGGINVNIEETSEKMAQHALYNWQAKYSNIKSELAAAFVRDLLIERAGGDQTRVPSILETLKELFETFLPGKKFDGPRPGKQGELAFPVFLPDGAEHDIDDLSSGEKELVYGYLRLRNVSPSKSIILLDEPELHLNPRIVLGLPSFYRQHLVIDLNNQLWMTTHSDAFLRDAFRGGGFSIFHMKPATATKADENQAVAVSATSQINQAIVGLVGNIAAFRPGNRVVLFESTENAGFDALVTTRLFPEFADQINALSGDNKASVRHLYEALDRAVREMGLPFQVYAIVDRDGDVLAGFRASARVFTWDVYHIENYFLEPEFIRKVMQDNPSFGLDMTEDAILEALGRCAEAGLDQLVTHELRVYVDGQLKEALDLGFDPRIADPAVGLGEAVLRVVDRIGKQTESVLSMGDLRRKREEIEDGLREALANETWRAEFRGRDILRRFAGEHLRGLPYEAFRDAILARMGDAGFQPEGMKKVIERILED